MTERTARETAAQAIADFDSIKAAIIAHKIKVPYAAATSRYAALISKIRVGSVTGNVCDEISDSGCETLIGEIMFYISNRPLNTLTGHAESLEPPTPLDEISV